MTPEAAFNIIREICRRATGNADVHDQIREALAIAEERLVTPEPVEEDEPQEPTEVTHDQ